MTTAKPTKPSKGQLQALRQIAGRTGTFHRIIAERLEHLGYATPQSTLFNMLVGCNTKFAAEWDLTEIGRTVIAAYPKKH